MSGTNWGSQIDGDGTGGTAGSSGVTDGITPFVLSDSGVGVNDTISWDEGELQVFDVAPAPGVEQDTIAAGSATATAGQMNNTVFWLIYDFGAETVSIALAPPAPEALDNETPFAIAWCNEKAAGGISGVLPYGISAYDQATALYQLAQLDAATVQTGGTLKVGALFTMDVAAGTMMSPLINYGTTPGTSRSRPLIRSFDAVSSIPLFRTYRDGSGGWKLESIASFDPTFYDDGSGTPASGSNNRWRYHIVYLALDGSSLLFRLHDADVLDIVNGENNARQSQAYYVGQIGESVPPLCMTAYAPLAVWLSQGAPAPGDVVFTYLRCRNTSGGAPLGITVDPADVYADATAATAAGLQSGDYCYLDDTAGSGFYIVAQVP